MLKKKFFAKAMAFAMVTGLLAAAAPVGITPVRAAEEEKKVTPVQAVVHYEGYSVVLTPGADKEGTADNYVFLEVMKKENDTKEGTVYPYPCGKSGNVTVDLSFLKINKPTYLRVWGDNSKEKVTLTVSAQPAKIKYKYVAQTFPEMKEPKEDGSDADKVAEDNQKALIDYYSKSFSITDTSKAYRVRSLYGGTYFDLRDAGTMGEDNKYVYDGKWDFNTTQDMLQNVKVTGTTLIIYEAPVENTYKADSDGNSTSEIDKAGAPMGAEVKVKIPAAPKAPKVAVDYVKGTIKLPKNAQYGMIQNGELEYVTLAAGGALAPKDILDKIADALEIKDDSSATDDAAKVAKTTFINENLAAGFNLVVRTNDAKKGPSNPQFVAVKETVTYDDDKWGKITQTTKNDKDEDVVTDIAEYEFTEEGVKVSFKSGSFEYLEAGKWKKISTGKLIKDKTELTIRRMGEKEDKNDPTKAKLPSTEMTIKKPVDKSEVTVAGAGDATKVTAESTLKLTATVVKDRNGEDYTADSTEKFEWSTSDKEIATVGTDGTVTGVKAGKCTITVTVTLKDKTTATGTFEITVEAKPAANAGA